MSDYLYARERLKDLQNVFTDGEQALKQLKGQLESLDEVTLCDFKLENYELTFSFVDKRFFMRVSAVRNKDPDKGDSYKSFIEHGRLELQDNGKIVRTVLGNHKVEYKTIVLNPQRQFATGKTAPPPTGDLIMLLDQLIKDSYQPVAKTDS